jgi:purine-nucleoside phosphorylase
MGTGGILKDVVGMKDVIVAGMVTTSPATRAMLCEWADKVIIAGEPLLREHIPTCPDAKLHVLDIGVDRWGFGRHPDLTRTICNKMRETGLAQITQEAEARYLQSNNGNLKSMVKEIK